MNVSRKTSLVVAAGTAVVAATAQLAGWPTWLSVILLLLVLASVIAALRDTAPSPRPYDDGAPTEQQPIVVIDPESQPKSSKVVYDVMLPSAVADYEFRFSATVCWRPVGPFRPGDAETSAVNAVVLRAQRELAYAEPDGEKLNLHQLSAALARPETDDGQEVVAWAERILVRLPEPYAQLAKVRGEQRLAQEVKTLNQALERSDRVYLKDEAFATPGSATIWWLSRHPEDLERALELYPTLRRLSDAANDRPEAVAQPVWSQFAEPAVQPMAAVQPPDLSAAVEILLDGLPDDERKLKASQLAKLEDRFNRPDRAEDIRQEFSPGVLPQQQQPENFTEDRPPSADLAEPATEPADSSNEVARVAIPSFGATDSPPYREEFHSTAVEADGSALNGRSLPGDPSADFGHTSAD